MVGVGVVHVSVGVAPPIVKLARSSVPTPRSKSVPICQPDDGLSSSLRVSMTSDPVATCIRPSSIGGFGRQSASPLNSVNGLFASRDSHRSSLKLPVRLTPRQANSDAVKLPPCRWK